MLSFFVYKNAQGLRHVFIKDVALAQVNRVLLGVRKNNPSKPKI